jgi:hypothetical protein
MQVGEPSYGSGVGVLLQMKHIAIKLFYFENGNNKINTLYRASCSK